MTGAFVFAFGCIVTLIVATAVGFLVWGAASEPSIDEVPDDRVAAHPPPQRAVPSSVLRQSSRA